MAATAALITRVSNDGGSSTGNLTCGNWASGDGMVLCANADENGTAITWTLSDNQSPDLTYVEINRRGDLEAGPGAVINYYVVDVGTITGLTVAMAVGGIADSPSMACYKITGHDTADMLGAIAEGTLSTDPQTTTGITSETAGGLFFANWTDWNQTGTPTSSDLTVSGFDTSGDISGASGYKSIASAGVSTTGNMNSGGTPAGNWTSFEIRAAAVVAKAPPPRHRPFRFFRRSA